MSQLYFLNDFRGKIFLTFHSINWPNFIVWLPLFLEILENKCIAIVCFQVFDVKNFEIILATLSSYFPTWPKIQDENQNILRTKRAFRMK